LVRAWQRLDGSLPPEVYLHAIREDAVDRNLLYLGTERGVSYSTDGGKSWRRLKLNLPTVAVHDLAVKGNTLVVGTHGRSIWAFDHLNLLREMTLGDPGGGASHLCQCRRRDAGGQYNRGYQPTSLPDRTRPMAPSSTTG
jgi:hypothetical protein